MQHTAREMQPTATGAGQISLDDLCAAVSAGGVHDEFLDQMLGGLPPSAWTDLSGGKAPEGGAQHQQKFGGMYDESALLASRLREHQISGGGGAETKQMADLRQGHHVMLQGMGRSTGGDGGVLLPLTLGSGGSGGNVQALLKAATNSAGGEAGSVFGGSFTGSLQQQQQQQRFQPHTQQQQTAPMSSQGFGGGGGGGGSGASQQQGGGAPAPPRQRVRARRGQATDPHSIAERLRRERIAERMKALQELAPNANKTDKASMLDEIIDYVKFLQLQVKGRGSGGGGALPAAESDGALAVTEQQVAKLMEEDMGTAMQYLQGKGLCLMPVPLASVISSATCHMRPPVAAGAGLGASAAHHMAAVMRLPCVNGDASAVPASPSMSVLTAQLAMANGAGAEQQQPPKDGASVSKP